MDVALSSGRTQRSPLSCDRAVKDGVAVRSEPFVCNDGTGTASLSDVGRLSNREPPCRVPIPVLSDLDYVSVSSFREHEPSVLHIHPNEYEFICCRRGRNLVFVRGPSRYFVHPGEVALKYKGNYLKLLRAWLCYNGRRKQKTGGGRHRVDVCEECSAVVNVKGKDLPVSIVRGSRLPVFSASCAGLFLFGAAVTVPCPGVSAATAAPLRAAKGELQVLWGERLR